MSGVAFQPLVINGIGGNDANTLFLMQPQTGSLNSDALGQTAAHTASITGSAAISSAQQKFGNVLSLPGSSYVSYSDQADFYRTGDYTVDFWAYSSGTPVSGTLFAKGPAAGYNQFYTQITSGGAVAFYSSSSGSSWDIAPGTSWGTLPSSSWMHFAVVRSGSNYYLFNNGAQTSTFTSSLTPYQTTAAFQLGAYASGSIWTGFLAEFRISNKARWTSNFTPPPQPYSF